MEFSLYSFFRNTDVDSQSIREVTDTIKGGLAERGFYTVSFTAVGNQGTMSHLKSHNEFMFLHNYEQVDEDGSKVHNLVFTLIPESKKLEGIMNDFVIETLRSRDYVYHNRHAS